MNATSVSDTAWPLLAHSWAISRIIFFITLSACARDIVEVSQLPVEVEQKCQFVTQLRFNFRSKGNGKKACVIYQAAQYPFRWATQSTLHFPKMTVRNVVT